jgi:predicted metal-dependent peptidase
MDNSKNQINELLIFTEKYHTLFRTFIEIGNIVFTDEIPTACIKFDSKGRYLSFLFNKEFWDSLNTYNRGFILCHELLHVVFNHGLRYNKNYSQQINNIAADLVVNNMLIKSFNFDRNKIKNWQKFCWFDTVKFKKTYIPTDRECEYYLPLIEDQESYSKNKQPNIVEFEHGEGFTQLNSNEFEELIEHEFQDSKKELKFFKAGKDAGGICRKVNLENIEKLDVWNKIVEKWTIAGRFDHSMALQTRWDRKPRRFDQIFQSDNDLCIACDVLDESKISPSKIRIALFMDTSGSCSNYANHFIKAAASLNKRFIVDLFCFDTKIYPTSIESGELFGFGGTSFDIIEKYIQNNMEKYPDAVWILTDGYGNEVNIQYPERWHWFLTENNDKRYIHKDSKIHALKDFYQ